MVKAPKTSNKNQNIQTDGRQPDAQTDRGQGRDRMNLQGCANDHDHVPFSLNTMIELIDVKTQKPYC